MEDEGSQDEQTELPEPVCKPLQVASLRQHCLLTLIRYRDALRECITRKTHNASRSALVLCSRDRFALKTIPAGDIGHVDHETVRQLLSHCNKDNLATIEDNTL